MASADDAWSARSFFSAAFCPHHEILPVILPSSRIESQLNRVCGLLIYARVTGGMGVKRILLTVIAMTAVSQAFAAPVRLSKPDKIEIQELVSNVLFTQEEQPYTCVLEGRALDGGWMTGDDATVQVKANSLQNAAIVSLTGYWTEQPKPGDRFVKVKVEGVTYSVRKVNCKIVDRSI